MGPVSFSIAIRTNHLFQKPLVRQVFSDVLDDPSDEDDSMDSQPGHTSMAARMQQQLRVKDMAAPADVPSSKRDQVKKGRRPGRVEET